MAFSFLPENISRSSSSTATANTLNDGSAAPTFRDEKRRLCPAFFCDASAPDQGDRGRTVELSADRQGAIAEAEQAARRVAKQRAALGRIGEQHLRQFEQRAVILPLRRAQVRPIRSP